MNTPSGPRLATALATALVSLSACGDDDTTSGATGSTSTGTQGGGGTTTSAQGGTSSSGGLGGSGGEGGAVTLSYTVGGTVTGLIGSLELENDGGDTLQIDADGSFVFPAALMDGESYEVTITSAPGVQRCQVEGGSGTVAGADVTDVAVRCDDLVFFHANDGVVGSELWVSDGTEAGTKLVRDINPNGDSYDVGYLAYRAGEHFVFNSDDDANGLSLWITDGTAAGTTIAVPGGAPWFEFFTSMRIGDTLYADAGDQLWRTDGTQAGTSLVVDPHPTGNASVVPLAVLGQQLLFYARNGTGTRPLWITDGTPAGTSIIPGPVDALSVITSGLGAPLGNEVVFRGQGPTGGRELWKTDGTEAGTALLADIDPNGFGDPRRFYTHNNETYFIADDGTHGVELWKTDGTTAGTTLVRDIVAGAASSNPRTMISLDATTLLFVANSPSELWKTDGTEAGTVLLKSFSSVNRIRIVGGKAVFEANDGVSGAEPWVTDGTVAGTTLLADINPGASGSGLTFFGFVGDTLLFSASEPVHGGELWRTDGTTVSLVKDIFPGPDDGAE